MCKNLLAAYSRQTKELNESKDANLWLVLQVLKLEEDNRILAESIDNGVKRYKDKDV